MSATRTTFLRLDARLARRLELEAARRDVTRQTLIRDLLDDFLPAFDCGDMEGQEPLFELDAYEAASVVTGVRHTPPLEGLAACDVCGAFDDHDDCDAAFSLELCDGCGQPLAVHFPSGSEVCPTEYNLAEAVTER